MAVTTCFDQPDHIVPERSTAAYRAKLTDEAGTALTAAALTTLTLTLYDLQGGLNTIVNSVDGVDIKNTGRGSIAADGTLTVTLTPADTAVLDDAHHLERRRMLLEWTWDNGNKAGRKQVDFYVQNLQYVP